MPDVEGAVCNPAYNRAGCRTPMQWDDGPNAGFSTADPDRLYLPIDPEPDRPSVAAQQADPSSTLHLVRELIALRKATPALGGRADTEVVCAGYPLAYVRGGSHLVVVNPRAEQAGVEVPDAKGATVLFGLGVTIEGNDVTVDGFGYAVLALAGRAS
jgi:glycosidase